MQLLEVSCAVRNLYMSLGAKGLMMYKAKVTVCSQINTKHINTVCAERTVVEC